MAHLGKFYPVHLRRDFSVDLTTYRAAMAKSYWLRSFQTTGVVGNELANKVLALTEANALTSLAAEWESQAVNIGGRIVHATMRTKLPWSDPSRIIEFEIFDSIQGSIGKGEFDWTLTGNYLNWQGRFFASSFVRPLLLSGPPSTSANLTRLTWPEFNAL